MKSSFVLRQFENIYLREMERTSTGIGSLHFAIGSHRGVDVGRVVGTSGIKQIFLECLYYLYPDLNTQGFGYCFYLALFGGSV